MDYRLFDDEVAAEMAADPETLGDWLVLEPSADYPGYWHIEAVYDDYFHDLEDLVGRFSVVSVVRFDPFLKQAQAKGYKVIFTEDPRPYIAYCKNWKDDPPFDLCSDREGTRQGFYPWQIVGFNKVVRSDLPAAYAVWDTGTGKTALIAASILWHTMQDAHDLALVFVKRHNKIEMQRKLYDLGRIESTVIDGVPPVRAEQYNEILERLQAGEKVTVISNYEKIRDDKVFDQLVKKRRVLFFWDEMPTKLSNMGDRWKPNKLYAATKEMLYKSFVSKPNPKWMRHLILTATPLQIDPGDVYSCLNLTRPYYLGTVAQFQNRYVRRRNWISGRPEVWGDLDELELRLDHMMHRVSEDDPEVAALLPKAIQHPRLIDWHSSHRSIYDKLTRKARDLYDDEEDVNVLSLIQVMQMLCDAPSMIRASAENRKQFEDMLTQLGPNDVVPNVTTGSAVALRLLETLDPSVFTDHKHTKLEFWKEIITERHPEDKIVTHSTWADYIFPVWEHHLQEWGVSYVVYAGTDRQKQDALDTFREDPSIRMFLSGDSGSDSIDIDQARVGVNYNGPWNWTTEIQRQGRRKRVTSEFKHIHTYTLSMANSVEDRKRMIRERKHGYHSQLFEGRAVESALSARLTKAELAYMLFGDLD